MSSRPFVSNETFQVDNVHERQRQSASIPIEDRRESRKTNARAGTQWTGARVNSTQKTKSEKCTPDEMFWGVLSEEDDDPSSGNQSETILVDRIHLPVGLRLTGGQHVRPSRIITRSPSAELCFPDDDPSRPSLSASFDSIISKVYTHTTIGLRVVQACDSLMSVLRDNYKKVYSQSGKTVQSLLDALQTLLDNSQLDIHSRMSISTAIVRLSRKSGLYPDSFKFSPMDIGRAGIYAKANSRSADIYKGYLRGRNVCFKTIKMHQDSDPEEIYKKVCREAVVWGQLSHPNILPFYGIYQVDDARAQIGFVSPWMHLGNILDVLKLETDIDCRLWISDIAAGMAYLHGHHIVHGGLKGGNILITESRRACLADLGTASVTRSPLRFPSSENTSNPSNDVYAFASLCYEIFTGELPVENHNIYTVMNGARASRPSSFYQRTRFLTDTMWTLMETCWEHDPDRRPTAAQIIEKLPRGSNDARLGPSSDWGCLSSSSFRTHHNTHDHQSGQDTSVIEALHALESTVAHIAGSHACRSPGPLYKREKTALTSRAPVSHPSSPLKFGYPAQSYPVLVGPDLHTRKLNRGDGLSYARHHPSPHSPVSPGQRRQWHDETETDTDTNFSSDRNSDEQSAEKAPFKETIPLASSPENFQEMRPLPTKTMDKLGDIVARISSVFDDAQQYSLFLVCQRSKVQMQALLDLLQELLDTPLDNRLRRKLVTGMQRLSKMSGLYPKCFALENINLSSDIPLAAGGFADVYKGSYQDQAVCLKVIRLYEAPRVDYVLKRFYQETSLWGKLSHPNLLPFYGQFRFHAQLSFVSPWLENGNVNDYLRTNPQADRVRLSSEIAAGLSYLHTHEIVHGDLKGANVLVTESGKACLSDFGLSTIIDSQILKWTSHTSVASKGGAIRWQAPELFSLDSDLEQNSKASDIYAWSCVLYEIFTGQVPFFEYRRDSTVMLNVGRGNRPSRPALSSLAWSDWGLTDLIWGLMEDCWKDNPDERPNVGDVLTWLQVTPETGQGSKQETWVNLPIKSFCALGEVDYPSMHEFEGLLWGTTTDAG